MRSAQERAGPLRRPIHIQRIISFQSLLVLELGQHFLELMAGIELLPRGPPVTDNRERVLEPQEILQVLDCVAVQIFGELLMAELSGGDLPGAAE